MFTRSPSTLKVPTTGHDVLKNDCHLIRCQRTLILFHDMGEYGSLPSGILHLEPLLFLEPSYLLSRCCTLVEQVQNQFIQYIDPTA